MFEVYGYKENRNQTIFYVGTTGDPQRMSKQFSAARRGLPGLLNDKIRNIGEGQIRRVVLGTFKSRADAELFEDTVIRTQTHISLGGCNHNMVLKKNQN